MTCGLQSQHGTSRMLPCLHFHDHVAELIHAQISVLVSVLSAGGDSHLSLQITNANATNKLSARLAKTKK